MSSFVWNSFFGLVCILSMFGSTTSSIKKEVYNYAFDVQPVDRCPMNDSEWQAAAARIGCNGTRGYHCVPDKFHSRLIEFCYNKTRIFVAKGNCLELAAYGVLNFVRCHEFTKGCPDKHYFSNELYKYPFCLSLAFQCFTSDIKCLDRKFKEQRNRARIPDCTTIDCEGRLSVEIILAFLLLAFVLVSMIILMKYRRKIQKLTTHFVSMGREEMVEKRQKDCRSDDLHVSGNVASELVFDDIYISLLLRRHCRNGVFKNFKYLLERRIMKKKNDEYDVNSLKILTSRDSDGCSLLHCAAEGGSVDIFKALIKAMDEVKKHFKMEDKIKIDDTTFDGRSVLHLACMNKQRSLCRHLLIDDNYKNLLLYKTSVQSWNAAHFAAVGGDIHIMDILESKKLDISVETKNGLNILDIACIHNNIEMCKDLMNRPDLSLLLDKADARGWTIAHFATMVGNTEIFNQLVEQKVKMMKTKNQKNILHVCCEYGNENLCKEILENFATMVKDKDDEDWNALHYAAKGGNLEVYKEIEKLFKDDLCKTTCDERTVLHIACINNRTDICKYICSKQSYSSIINSTGEFRGWTAAHYVAVEERQDGTEETLIRILERSGVKLEATTVDKLTVLGVACEHRNKSLINYLLNNHSKLLDVETNVLKAAAKSSNDDYIDARITEAIDIYNRKKVRKGSELLEKDDVDIKLPAKHGSEENLVLTCL